MNNNMKNDAQKNQPTNTSKKDESFTKKVGDTIEHAGQKIGGKIGEKVEKFGNKVEHSEDGKKGDRRTG